MKGYRQLGQDERLRTYTLAEAGNNRAIIADVVDCDRGTISREQCGNPGLKVCRTQQDHNLAVARRCDKAQSCFVESVESVHHVVVDGLTPYIKQIHTITCDNCREFADRAGMVRGLDARSRFVHPCASRRGGLDENANSFVLQYLMKQLG